MSLPQWFPEYGLDLSGRAKPQTQRQSQYKSMPGLLPQPEFKYSHLGSPGTSFMRNSAPTHKLNNYTGHDLYPWIAGGKRRELTAEEKKKRDTDFTKQWKQAQDDYFTAKKNTDFYNNVYKTGYDGINRIPHLLTDDARISIPDYEWQSKNKRPVEKALFDWSPENRKTRTEMDYVYGHKYSATEKRDLEEFVRKIMTIGASDAVDTRELRTLERDQWAADDEINSKRAAIEQQYMALMDQARRAQEDQARYIQAYNVASQARQARMSDKFRQRFEGDPAQGRSGGGIEAASAKLLTFKGLDNDPKLGARGKLGARSLLGG